MQHNYENSSISVFLLVYKSLSSPFLEILCISVWTTSCFLSAIVKQINFVENFRFLNGLKMNTCLLLLDIIIFKQ